MNRALLKQALAAAAGLARGTIATCRPDGLLEVMVGDSEPQALACQVLMASEPGASCFAEGDDVLLAIVPGSGSDGVVLGKVGSYESAPSSIPEAVEAADEEADGVRTIKARQIVLEADQELTLRCGSGTVRIQEDGKVIIRGEHVLNAARGTNRIKGGSVGIN